MMLIGLSGLGFVVYRRTKKCFCCYSSRSDMKRAPPADIRRMRSQRLYRPTPQLY